MHEHAYRRLDRLADAGEGATALELEIARYPEADQVPLMRYAWGLFDDHGDTDRADALWLHAWLAEERHGGPAHSQPV